MDWAKTTARRDEKYLRLGFDAPYIKGLTAFKKLYLRMTCKSMVIEIFTRHPTNYTYHSCCVVFRCSLIPVDAIHVHQGYFHYQSTVWLSHYQWSSETEPPNLGGSTQRLSVEQAKQHTRRRCTYSCGCVLHRHFKEGLAVIILQITILTCVRNTTWHGYLIASHDISYLSSGCIPGAKYLICDELLCILPSDP